MKDIMLQQIVIDLNEENLNKSNGVIILLNYSVVIC